MSEPVLKFMDLYKNFSKTAVLKGISAEVNTGEVIGLLGLNGAGKTTLLETALGFLEPSAGSAKVFGVESFELNDKEIKIKIGYVTQQDELLPTMNGKNYLKLIAGFYDNWDKELCDRLCEEWQIPLDKKIQHLSVGQRQKLSIVSALGHKPELLILDEPVASLDPVARRQFLKELVSIASENSRTILFSTHIVSDLERIASRIWLMKEGVIHIDEDLDSLKERCARIHLPPNMTLPLSFDRSKIIHQRHDQNTHTLTFGERDDEQQKALEESISHKVTVEWLSLEEIFLEIHS